MNPRALALAALLSLSPCAFAQEIPPVPDPSGGVTAPGVVEPAPPPPSPSAPAFAPLDGVTATLAAPRTANGSVSLTLRLTSTRTAPVALGAARDNDQNCAVAPSVRVLRVGTREIVYPVPGAAPSICTQEIVGRSIVARGNTVFTRTLSLPAGEYMIEGWFAGLSEDVRVKVPASPVRVTVR